MAVIVFHRLAETRICPDCGGPLNLYLIEQGIQLLACLNCPFDVVDGKSQELVLNKIRQMAERDRREHAEHKRHVIQKRDV